MDKILVRMNMPSSCSKCPFNKQDLWKDDYCYFGYLPHVRKESDYIKSYCKLQIESDKLQGIERELNGELSNLNKLKEYARKVLDKKEKELEEKYSSKYYEKIHNYEELYSQNVAHRFFEKFKPMLTADDIIEISKKIGLIK